MDVATDVDLSIAQMEAELRAAQAYLTMTSSAECGVGTAAVRTEEASPYERMRQPMAENESSFFKRPARVRALIPGERRKEILAKLSSERQAAVRSIVRTPPPSCTQMVSEVAPAVENGRHAGEPSAATHANVIESFASANGDHDRVSGTQYDGHDVYAHKSAGRANDDEHDEYDKYGNEQDGGEVFYASDVIGKSVHEHIAPRTALDFVNIDDEGDDDALQDTGDISDEDGAAQLKTMVPIDYRPPTQEYHGLESSSESVFAKLLARRDQWNAEGIGMPISQLLPSHTDQLRDDLQDCRASDAKIEHVDELEHERDNRQDFNNFAGTRAVSAAETDPFDDDFAYSPLPRKVDTAPPARSRIEALARPRTQLFADREKQRLVNEMEALKECTFQPVLLKASRLSLPLHTISDARKRNTKSVHFEGSKTSAGHAFPWLTLSPRQRSTSRKPGRTHPTLIDRLNLDVSVKYEARERLREILETEKMRECTFQPQINSASRRLLSRTDYKPIHERIGEVQREKVEYIQRIREELAYEEGAFSFTPQINPRSREIAETVLCEKQVAKIRASTRKVDVNDKLQLLAMLRPPAVTERLVDDAEQMAEKRVAVQEYYDALEEKSFVPTISETSHRLVEGKPEFKLDFLSRQEYFRMVEQEKLEALEDVVHHEQELTFRPDIGNAAKVLREMRPDLVHETPQQRLDRLVYHEPRRKEMVKQRRRDEEYGKHPFKPEINHVSKALVEKAKVGAPSKTARRHELQRYFAGKQFRSRVAKELEQAEKAECTFRPHLISRPKVKSSSTSKLLVKHNNKSVWRSDTILHTIETQRQQRAEDLESKRNALELKELENCTFQPNIRRPPRRPVSHSVTRGEKPVVVRGLGRFLELKERAKRQQEDQKQREEKVFNPNSAYEPRSYTVPKPFNLSETNKDSIRRRLKLREEMRSKERTECTFAPRTLEAQQRQVLRALLKD